MVSDQKLLVKHMLAAHPSSHSGVAGQPATPLDLRETYLVRSVRSPR
jgi:hypothetical protein